MGSAAREDILAAARRQFAERGYPATTLRAVADEAGVDPRLISHYFGSKHALFTEVFELPFDPQGLVESLTRVERSARPAAMAAFAVGVLDTPASRDLMTGLLRAGMSEPEAAVLVRDILNERLVPVIAQLAAPDRPALRASLIGSLMAGLAVARHIISVPDVAAVASADLVAAITPVIAHYLDGDLPVTQN